MTAGLGLVFVLGQVFIGGGSLSGLGTRDGGEGAQLEPVLDLAS
jgi:hypothetical protein